MLCCLSVGISNYKNKNLVPIPCAASDARSVYDTFQQIMGNEFDHHLSVCVSNILSDDFERLLSIVSDVIGSSPNQSEQILVVYFSGHGGFNEKSLELRFPNYEGSHNSHDDFFPADLFTKNFKNLKNKVLIILDCCNSGAALPLANNDDQSSEISVLASVNSYASAKFSEDGSEFTKILCKSIRDIMHSGETFSLNSLINKIKSNGYENLFVHRGAAQEIDLVFQKEQPSDNFDQDFSELFFDHIARGNILSREAIWYSLNDFPDKNVYEASARYFDLKAIYGKRLPREANWLVRRAIGSTLANHVSDPFIRNLLDRLLESEYWQEQCIALIGLRHIIAANDKVCGHVLSLVSSNKIAKIDAVWIAALYASGNKKTDWSIFLNTNLSSTPWGMIELCKAYGLFENLDDERLRKHIFYKELTTEKERQAGKGLTKLEKYVYSKETRGRLPVNSKVKFLLSALYGNWRDQIRLNLKEYFDCTDVCQAEKELQDFQNVHNAERKMALFTYFNRNYKEVTQYTDALKWGLLDTHPWVRRTAMEFYQKMGISDEELRNNYFTAQFGDGYPGLLDYYLTCPVGLQQELIHHLESNEILLKGDLQSLNLSFSCE